MEAIGIIGMAVRLPQDATSPENFWRMLMKRQSAQTQIPASRLRADAHKIRGNVAHFVKEDIAAFDAPFFTMSPADAEAVDPMQRWLLETTYEALENAGLTLKGVSGSKTSVHIGVFSREYEAMARRDPVTRQTSKAFGTLTSMLANRISWFYDLKGPSLTIDTACSGSMYALHLACTGLLNSDADMAIVGGCNLFFNPDSMSGIDEMGLLSPDGISYSFDHRANGYSRGEGFGVVVLKRMSAAIADGDTVRAVIRATGANTDGKTAIITQPSSSAQEALIRSTYQKAGLDISLTRFFEAHATGTPVGDPIEAKAIHAVFGKYRGPRDPLVVGAVKGTIGHLESAAGIAGIIKTVMVLEKGIIPPNTYFEKQSPQIPQEWNLKFPTEAMRWPTCGIRRASVNSFGLGGANAHVILDDARSFLSESGIVGLHQSVLTPALWSAASKSPGPGTSTPTSTELSTESRVRSRYDPNAMGTHKQPLIFVFSAADSEGLRRLYWTYKEYLIPRMDPQSTAMRNLAFTLSEKRSHLAWKSFVTANTLENLYSSLSSQIPKPIRVTHPPKITFIFTGQGAQWPMMGQGLLRYEIFRRTLDNVQSELSALGCSFLLINELMKDQEHSRLSEPGYCQPICTAVQIALVELLRFWNIRPDQVIGHSSGEIAAAYCAGMLSLESAIRISYYRGVVSERLRCRSSTPMSMLATTLSAEECEAAFTKSGLQNDLSIACINSPRGVTVSGCTNEVENFERSLGANIHSKMLNVDVAYHSKYMVQVAASYGDLLGYLWRPPHSPDHPPMYSSVTGDRVTTQELEDAAYWVRNMTSQVKFSAAVTRAFSHSSTPLVSQKSQSNVCIEIGPHSTLKGPLLETISTIKSQSDFQYLSVLLRHRPAEETAMNLIGSLWCHGLDCKITHANDSDPLLKESPRMLVDLPSYPFNHTKKYWSEGRLSKNFRFRQEPYHSLLGTQVLDWNIHLPRWRNSVSERTHPWISDHKVSGLVIYPAAAMVITASEAARQMGSSGTKGIDIYLKGVSIGAPIIFRGEDAEIEIETCLYGLVDDTTSTYLKRWNFKIFAHEGEKSWEACAGSVSIMTKESSTNELDAINPTESLDCTDRTDVKRIEDTTTVLDWESFYQTILPKAGLKYGPAFRNLRDIRLCDHNRAMATIEIATAPKEPRDNLQKLSLEQMVILDSALQLSLAARHCSGYTGTEGMVPNMINDLRISKCRETIPSNTTPNVIGSATWTKRGRRRAQVDISVGGEHSDTVLISGSVEVSAFEGERSTNDCTRTRTLTHMLYEPSWKPDIDAMDPESILIYCSTRSGGQESVHDRSIPSVAAKRLYCETRLWQLRQMLQWPQLLQGVSKSAKYCQWAEAVLLSLSLPDQAHLESLAIDFDAFQKLECEMENGDHEAKVISIVGKNLNDLVKAKCTLLEVLYTSDNMSRFYSHRNRTQGILFQVCRYLDLKAHKCPNLKILEIGAGTGGATAMAIGALAQSLGDSTLLHRFRSYTFTDISPSFLQDAEFRFKRDCNNMLFSVLDISRHPEKQGFSPNEYDIIIASNVLHATPSIHTALQHVSYLLKPGGKLVLHESIDRENTVDGFIFGLATGWVKLPGDSRSKSPILSIEQWHHCLAQSGLSGVDITFRIPEKVETTQDVAAMISTKPYRKNRNDQYQNDLRSRAQFTFYHAPHESLVAGIRANDSINASIDASYQSYEDIDKLSQARCCCMILPKLANTLLHNISDVDFQRLQTIFASHAYVAFITTQATDSPLGPTNGMVEGLRRVIHTENPKLTCATLTLDATTPEVDQVSQIEQFLQKTLYSQSVNADLEYRVIDGSLSIPRLIPHLDLTQDVVRPQQSTSPTIINHQKKPLVLELTTTGALDSFHFIDLHLQKRIDDEDIEIEVHHSGLNFKDVLTALGKTNDSKLGLECSGIITKAGIHTKFQVGDRVCAMVSGSFQTHARCNFRTAARVPKELPLRSAAAVPVIFPTALYAIHHLARLKQGESILIHSGAGGLGQATIQLAQLLKANIFTTVSTVEKKQYLVETYGLEEDQIFSSRTPAFMKHIMSQTLRKGVDVVINSLSGEGSRNSWACLAPLGRFIEVGLRDVVSQSPGSLPLSQFESCATFAAANIDYICKNQKDLYRALLQESMSLWAEGQIQLPSPVCIFKASEVEEAMRLMQSGKSMGKIIVDFATGDKVMATLHHGAGQQQLLFVEDATYVIAGGLGGVGKSIASWMVSNGARNLLLLSRSGATTTKSRDFVTQLMARGAKVFAAPCDITNETRLSTILQEGLKTMPPIRGCIQSAMALHDEMLSKMTASQFNNAAAPKVAGTWNLHKLLPAAMDFFIVLSSAGGISGRHGQANYVAGNTYQDALVEMLVSERLRPEAAVLDLGPIDSVGHVFENKELLTKMRPQGAALLSENNLHEILRHYCDNTLARSASRTRQVVTGLITAEQMAKEGINIPTFLFSPIFSNLFHIHSSSEKEMPESSKEIDWQKALHDATSSEQRVEVITNALRVKLGALMAVEASEIDVDKSIHAYGVDSLTAVELQGWMRRSLGRDVTVFEILGSQSMEELAVSMADMGKRV